MSILETFYILFESNADEVEKGAKKAEKSTDDLEKQIKSADQASTKLGAGFNSMIGSAVSALAAFVSIGAITTGIFRAANYADRLDETSQALGVNIEEWDAWTRATKIAGGSAEGLESSVRNLNANLAQIAATGSSRIKPFLDQFGISIKDSNGQIKNGIDLLPELAEAFEGLSAAEISGIGQKMGLDSGTIMLLQKGRNEINDAVRRQKELGTVLEKDAQKAAAFNDALDDMNSAWTVLGSRISGAVLPPLTWLVNKLTEFAVVVRENSNFFVAFVSVVAAGITVLIVKSGVLAGIWGMLNLPLLGMVAAITAIGIAIAVVYDDVMAFFNGMPSITGKVVDAFVDMAEKIKALWNGILDYIKGILNKIIEGINYFNTAFGGEEMKLFQTSIQNAEAAPLAAQSSAAIVAGGNKSSVFTVQEVNIQTQATDAEGISQAIGTSLQDAMKATVANYDDGVRG